MCGIAGVVFWEPETAPADPVEIVTRMTGALAHRGPDGHGVSRCGPGAGRQPAVVFGHRRLAIIDLSDRGRQPMALGPRGVYLTYNGEIYNYRALRQELEADGRVFTSTSDTEVILQGYDAWGSAVVDRLRGMFAFAIWDARRAELLLVRDRLGIKPLYGAAGDGFVAFASEARALLASGLIRPAVDPVSLSQYLAYQTVPAPRTLLRDVRMLAPGEIAISSRSAAFRTRTFWDLLGTRSTDARDADAATSRERVGHLLTESMTDHFVSDVPVGIFLSGGIDSSALVSLATSIGQTPHTFAVTFPGLAEDESVFARTVAAEFGTVHTEVPIRPEDAVDGVREALAGLDQPTGDGINTFLVARAVRSAGLKVALSGLGGDELFGGYPSFDRLERLTGYAPALKHTPRPARQVAAAAMKLAGRSSVASAKAAALMETGGALPEAFPILRQMFSPAERAALLTHPWQEAAAAPDPYVSLLRDAGHLAETEVMTWTSYAEARTYMHDVLLRDTDQMSMHHGLEVRVPLLDHRLVEYVMGLRDDVKRPAGGPKSLLTASLPRALPAAVVKRRKQGFVLPLDRWMRHELRETCETALGPRGLGSCEAFQPAAINRLWAAFLAGDRRTSWSRVWTLVALGDWLTRHAAEVRL